MTKTLSAVAFAVAVLMVGLAFTVWSEGKARAGSS